MTSIARNHALFDGNKRFSWYLTLAFFKLNGYRVVMSNDEAYELVLAVATGAMELDELAATFARWLVELPLDG
jgi:death-on-curing protein